MKKVLFVILFLSIPFIVKAQFKASSAGFIAENGKDYIVFDIPNKSAEELYVLVCSWVNSTFENPDIVSNNVENKQINIHAYYDKAYVYTRDNFLGINYWSTADINYIIQFKDEKIRVNSPVINAMYLDGNKNSRIGFCGTKPGGSGIVSRNLFKKDGNENKPKAIANINNFINGEIDKLIKYVLANKDEDW